MTISDAQSAMKAAQDRCADLGPIDPSIVEHIEKVHDVELNDYQKRFIIHFLKLDSSSRKR